MTYRRGTPGARLPILPKLLKVRAGPGGKDLLVSERFKTAFVENDLRGAVFTPAESPEAGYDSYPWESQAESNE